MRMVHNIRKGHLSVAGGNQFASSSAAADKQSRRSTTHLKKCRSVVRMNVSSECHSIPKYHLGRLHFDHLGDINFLRLNICHKISILSANTNVSVDESFLSYQLIPQIHRLLSRFYRGIVADLKRLQIC